LRALRRPRAAAGFSRAAYSVEGYRRGGRLVVQERVAGRSPQEMLARIFAAGGADYAHLRNAEAGCFMARVDPSP